MKWVDNIFSFVWDISDWFLDAYLEVSGWIWPFNHLKYPLYGLYKVFWGLLNPIAHFGAWARDIWLKVEDIISEWDIWSILSVPIRWAEDAWNWVRYAWINVLNLIGDWWGSTSCIVLGWIDVAKQWLSDRIEEVKALASKTSSDLSNFFTVTLPQLVGWGELDSIIISYLRTWFPMYNSFCLLWDSIEEFFADPLEWIYNRLEDFFERYW